MFIGIAYGGGKRPVTSEPLETSHEAKKFCADHCSYDDDVWVVLKNGKVWACGLIDGMWEDEEDDDDMEDQEEEEEEAE